MRWIQGIFVGLFVIIVALIGYQGYVIIKESKPKKELAIYMQLDDGLFFVHAVVEKEKWFSELYSNRLECGYFSNDHDISIQDTLKGNVWPARVLELESVFFGIMTDWSYFPKTQYGVLLPSELQEVYRSNRPGHPDINGYMPVVMLQLTNKVVLEYSVQDKVLSLFADNELIDKRIIGAEFDAIQNAHTTESAVEFLRHYRYSAYSSPTPYHRYEDLKIPSDIVTH
ncbi:MAG TPA: hypothetical protein P5533_04570 [Candidatus Cloacimonadota bacterium]|nr:hypothetical protein [Candidatus Cloacimonadota bacterium]